MNGEKDMRQYGATDTSLRSESDIYRMLEQPGDREALRARCTTYEIAAHGPEGRYDAFKVALEHRQGTELDIVIPIRHTDDAVVVDMQSATASTGEPRLWHRHATPSE